MIRRRSYFFLCFSNNNTADGSIENRYSPNGAIPAKPSEQEKLKLLITMKKKIYLVASFVAIAMSAMFVACEGNSKPANGCICTITDKENQKETLRLTFEDMVDQYQATTCGELTVVIKDYIPASSTAVCKGY